jgi:hypothetical protein
MMGKKARKRESQTEREREIWGERESNSAERKWRG